MSNAEMQTKPAIGRKTASIEKAQIRVTRPSAACWRVTFDNPPLNLMR